MSLEVSGLASSNILSPDLHPTPPRLLLASPVIIELRCDKSVARREHAFVGQPSRTVSGEPTMTHRTALFVSVAVVVAASFAPAAQAQKTSSIAEQVHLKAVTSFQQGRFPEAYGRFIALADAGHAPAAELALFMFQNGPALFGKDWDVTQEQLTAWAALNGRPAPVLTARSYPRTGAPVALTSR